MFAGIIEHVGTVVRVDAAARPRDDGSRAHALELDLGPLADGLALGASVAVNGACLTLASRQGHVGRFDVVPETWQHTTLRSLRPAQRVNLERSLALGDRIDGHFVQGHVDGIGTVDHLDRAGGEWKLWVRADAGLLPYVIPKGSIALDGTSLTIAEVGSDRFCVALVPTTLERTTLRDRGPGDALNIETDILARVIVTRLEALAGRGGIAPGGVTLDKLREGGFLR